MKKLVVYFFGLISYVGLAQSQGETYGGKYTFNPSNLPCISSAQKAAIKEQLATSIASLEKQDKLTKVNTKMIQQFSWPVRKSSESEFADFWGISNFVDHDAAFPDKLRDYTCGVRTYDTNSGYNHQGLDIYTWPFTWFQMENNMAEIIAPADGVIIFKSDGKPDKSCSFNNNQWNAVYLRHDDGSVTWFGHMKSGSLTSKNVGESVVRGEYLGVIGSSGNSTGPHLHFEIYDSSDNLIDPYNGICNNTTTWWADQKEYYEPNINAVLTHSTPPVFNTCPTTETVNLSDEFAPNVNVYLASYFRDQQSGTAANYRLYRPNGSVFSAWNRNFTNTWSSSYWYWSFNNLTDIGDWRFEVTYQGKTESKTFKVGSSTLSIEDKQLEKVAVGPNPFQNTLKLNGIAFDLTNYEAIVYNNLGQQVYKNINMTAEMNLSFLTNGVYFLKIQSKTASGSKTFPIIKN